MRLNVIHSKKIDSCNRFTSFPKSSLIIKPADSLPLMTALIFSVVVMGCSQMSSLGSLTNASTNAPTNSKNKQLSTLRKTADAMIIQNKKATPSQRTQTVGGNSNTQFGINYWPQSKTIGGILYQQSEVLYDAAWPTMRPQVVKDMDSMSALGVTTLRLMFWPNYSGFGMSHFGGWDYASGQRFIGLQKNLKDFLALAQQHQMNIVIVFANRYILDYVCGADQTSPYTNDCTQYPYQTWWQWGYGDAWLDHNSYWQSAAFVNFLSASNQWMSGIVAASESSAGASQVIFYDYFNEYATQPSAIADPLIADYQNWYVQYVFQWVTNVPVGKRGISFLHTDTSSPGTSYGLDEDAAGFKALVGQNAVQWVDFHPYAGSYWDWAGQNLEAYKHDIAVNNWVLQQNFPSAKIVMGEFGLPSTNSQFEQAKWDMTALEAASHSGIQLAMHWGFWEDSTGSTGGLGYGSAPGAVRDLYGVLADTMAGYKNLDFEDTNNYGLPTSWSASATYPRSLQLLSATAASGQYGGSSTGSHYARMQLGASSAGGVWMVHDPMPTYGATHATINFQYRSGLSNVQAVILQYDSNGQMIAQGIGPACTPNDWNWHDYIQECGAQQVAISENATQVVLAITGTNPSLSASTQYLDIDTVSFSIR